MESDLAFARRRALEERLAALQAVHPNVRRVHEDFAARYEKLIRGMSRESTVSIKPRPGPERTHIWL